MLEAILPARVRPVSSRYLRWRLAIPPEKGGWVWWIGPLVVGAVAAPSIHLPVLLVAVAAWVAFCLRQPVTLAARQLRKRHGTRELAPPLAWAAGYALVLTGLAGLLWTLGHGRLVAVGVLAAPVFAWHLTLVYLGRDRRQQLLDVTAAAALALVAPAAYWAGGGEQLPVALWVWALAALQSAASVVHMFLRLEQRALPAVPPMQSRLAAGLWPMAVHAGALAAATGAYGLGHASVLVIIALAIPFAEGLWSVWQPQVGHPPKRLGMRQLAVSSASMLLLAMAFWAGQG